MNFALSTINTKSSNVVRLMDYGDVVILYLRHDHMESLLLEKDKVLNNKFGVFPHSYFVGKPFGIKLQSDGNGTGWICVLEPTPELWSQAVYTRTQIVNEVDASVCTFYLDVYPGCKVVDTGTGSGCMTISLARAVAPHGHVYTYEYNNQRAVHAQEEFKRLKIDDLITVQCKDVCGKYGGDDGGFPGLGPKSIDAVFLDLPEPWLAIKHAKYVLKSNKYLCCYSPCIEQVVKTCEKMREEGFHSINMIEVRQRPFDGRVNNLEIADIGTDSTSAKKEGDTEEKNTNEGTVEEVGNDNNDHIDDDDEDDNEDDDDVPSKRSKKNEDETVPKKKAPYWTPKPLKTIEKQVARPLQDMKGHTAFLYFGICPDT